MLIIIIMQQTSYKNYLEITDSGKIHVNRSKLFKSEEFKDLVKRLANSSIAKKINEYKEKKSRNS